MTGLIDRGHDVRIFAFQKGDTTKMHNDIIKYNLLKRTYFGNRLPHASNFDIVYCQFGFSGKNFLRRRNSWFYKSDTKLVTCFRGVDISKFVKKRPKIYNELFRKGNLFLPVCRYFKKKLIRLGCKRSRILVHHSAIDCRKFAYTKRSKAYDEPIKILSVCRLVEKKGMEYAIKAVAQLLEKYPNIQYTIVGDGPLRQKLSSIITELGVADNIHLVGAIVHDQVVQMLDTSHIFVLPSVTASDGNEEGIPNAIKEAMAMGLPVISTFHAGIPELVEDGVSGFLVPQRDYKALAKKIAYVIEHPEKWPEMGRAGRQKVEDEYNIEKLLDRLERIFRNMMRVKNNRIWRLRR